MRMNASTRAKYIAWLSEEINTMVAEGYTSPSEGALAISELPSLSDYDLSAMYRAWQD